MKIDVYALCKNEIKLAPFVADYWKALADEVNVYLYDGMSNDGTRELLSQFDWIHFIDYNTELDDIKHKQLKDTCWKQSRGKADFVMVCDFDETIFSYDAKTLREKLEKMKELGGTILAPLSFNIVSDNFPEYQKGKYLHELCQYGFNDYKWESKPILFNPNEIEEINFTYGGHIAKPTGNVKWFYDKKLFLIHCKFIGYDFYVERIKNRKIAEESYKAGFYGETEKSMERLKSDFEEVKSQRFLWDEAITIPEKYYSIIHDWRAWGLNKVEWKDIN